MKNYKKFWKLGRTEYNTEFFDISKNGELLVKEGKFRDDLYYRLKVVPITLPSLAERREDIPMLVHHFLQKCAAGPTPTVRGVLPETMALLTQYRWPGNVRELENVIERAVSLSHGPLLTPDDLPESIRQGSADGAEGSFPHGDLANEATLTLEEVEKRHLILVLKETKGNKVKAAKILGIDRRTLYRMAERFGLPVVCLIDTKGAFPGTGAGARTGAGGWRNTSALTSRGRLAA